MDGHTRGLELEKQVGLRMRAVREAAGLTQKQLADRLGISEHKLLNLERNRSRPNVADVIDVADALGVPMAVLLEDVMPAPPLDWFFTARNPALAYRAPDSVDHRIAATTWIERYYANKFRLPYPPIYYLMPFRRPVVFKEVWQLPVDEDPRRWLYVADGPKGLVGYFFPEEIQPSPDMEKTDSPWPADIRDWKDQGELERYLEAQHYCLKLHPSSEHVEEYCSPEHRRKLGEKRQ
jgi:transcriptional regulator with XRE-family HTH domain